MGGKALNKVYTRRYEKVEYLALCEEVSGMIKSTFNKDVHVVKAYAHKESHGDLDILLMNDGTLGNVFEKIDHKFAPGQIVSNGGVYSFDYKEFQIDVILTNVENWESAKAFFDFDPSGNLMGKVAHKFGLKYGFDGLTYPYRAEGGTVSKNILISRDCAKIFEFLGFDYEEYQRGFLDKQQIFDYVIDSEYFLPDNFKMENLNHIDKKRNRKRPTYQEFLAYVNDLCEQGHSWENKFKENKREYLPIIAEAFPESNLMDEIDKCIALDERRKTIASKFNGNMISQMYGLSGKELGDFIIGFREHTVGIQRGLGMEGLDKEIFDAYVYTCEPSIIESDIKEYFDGQTKKSNRT